MSVKVSVVVPVYNPGHYIDDLIASLLRQSLAPEAYEVIFVDDGSTDETPVHLERLAAEHPNITLIRIPNSGWPGRPRNVGLDASVGAYVYFVDNDDWLSDEAIERLWLTAERTGADVVVGKEVGHGRGVPRHLFRRNVDDATFDNAPLLALLTPHKLFRRSFLDRHAIRFPEGRRRLEDHVFVMKAYFHASRISILADYPCYHWVRRDDAGNATDRYADPAGYYENVREVLDIVDEHTEPGPVRNRMYAHWFRSKGLERLKGQRWAAGPDPHAEEVYAEVRRLALERFGPPVIAELPLKFRTLAHAVLADRPDLVSAQARLEHGMQADVELEAYERSRGRVRLSMVARLRDGGGRPMRFARVNDRMRWAPEPPPGWEGVVPEEALDATDELAVAGVGIVLRERASRVEYDLPARAERTFEPDGRGGVTPVLRAHAEIDTGKVAAGGELGTGTWDLFAHVHAAGWRSVRRLADVAEPELRPRLQMHTTQFGNLSLKLGEAVAPPAPRRRPHKEPRQPPAISMPSGAIPRAVMRAVPRRMREAAKRALLRVSGGTR